MREEKREECPGQKKKKENETKKEERGVADDFSHCVHGG